MVQGSNGDADVENRLMNTEGKDEDEWRQKQGNIYITICKTDSQWESGE